MKQVTCLAITEFVSSIDGLLGVVGNAKNEQEQEVYTRVAHASLALLCAMEVEKESIGKYKEGDMVATNMGPCVIERVGRIVPMEQAYIVRTDEDTLAPMLESMILGVIKT